MLSSTIFGAEQPSVTEPKGADSGEKGLDGVTNAPNVVRVTSDAPPQGADSGEKASNQPAVTKPAQDSNEKQQNENANDGMKHMKDGMGQKQKGHDSQDGAPQNNVDDSGTYLSLLTE